MTDQSIQPSPILQSLTTIVAAHLGNNPVALSEVPGFIETLHQTLTRLEGGGSSSVVPDPAPEPASEQLPAVPITQSVTDDHIICLEDGRRLRMLKRYLMAQYGMTPEAYRTKWGLPSDYPMVAPSVAKQRQESALGRGFGKAKAPVKAKRGK